jgi:hypothetical protein
MRWLDVTGPRWAARARRQTGSVHNRYAIAEFGHVIGAWEGAYARFGGPEAMTRP